MRLILANLNLILFYLVLSVQAETVVIVCPYASIEYDEITVYNLDNQEYEEDQSCVDEMEVYEYGEVEIEKVEFYEQTFKLPRFHQVDLKIFD